jgi:hypothetical protein
MEIGIKKSAEVLEYEQKIKKKLWFNKYCDKAVAERDKTRLKIIHEST